MNLRTAPLALFVLVAVPFLSAGTQRAQGPREVTGSPYKAGAIYDLGETVGWNLKITPDASATGPETFDYKVTSNGVGPLASGQLQVKDGVATVEVKPTEPMMVFLQVTSSLHKNRHYEFGAALAPTKLKPVVPRPRDFDVFWKRKIKELLAIPENAEITPKDSGMPDVDYATIKMDHIGGRHIYGQMAKPKGDGKYPAMLIFQWASPPYPLDKSWVTWRAKQGWLVLNIEPHDVPTDAPQSFYQALPQSLKNYNTIGMEDRETSYFLQMYLADYRAVEYMSHRPDWDGKTLLVMGTSMGGQQSLCVAGLHPKITHLIVNVPAGCDQTGPAHGRSNGYPFLPLDNPKVAEASRYFDAVNFAPHIKATSLVAMGFVDTVAPPAGIWTAFDLIRGKKEAAPMFDSPHNNLATPQQQKPFTSRSEEWLAALVKGQPIPPLKP